MGKNIFSHIFVAIFLQIQNFSGKKKLCKNLVNTKSKFAALLGTEGIRNLIVFWKIAFDAQHCTV